VSPSVRRFVPLALLLSACVDAFAYDTFDYDAHGWGLEGQTLETRPRLDKTHGDPSGNLCASDDPTGPEDRPWRFVGSTAYTGDASSFYGRSITWEASTNAACCLLTDVAAVFIDSDAGTLSVPPNNHAVAKTQWSKLYVSLDTSSPWVLSQNDGGFVLATEENLRSALKNMTAFRIRGEWSGEAEASCIDNIYFGVR
jgi:hypothetical protein